MRQQPFASPEEALQHYGVKGMKWGQRKGRESGRELVTHNTATKRYMAEAKTAPPPSPERVKELFSENRIKSAEKIAPSGAADTKESKSIKERWNNLSPGQKEALAWGAGAVAVYGALWYAGNRMDKAALAKVKKEYGINSLEDIKDFAGKPIDPKKFHGLVGLTQGNTWLSETGYMHASAFTRPEFELPAGHTFFRLSTAAEDKFEGATYSLHSLADFNRYVSGFRQEKGLTTQFNKVSWKTTRPTKVPNLTTVLGQMSEVLKNEGQVNDAQSTMKAYGEISGGNWSSSRSKNLIGRLKGMGYGAIVDEMDAGVIGETPLVFFDTKNVTPKKSVPFGLKDIKAAEAALTEIGRPPGRKLP